MDTLVNPNKDFQTQGMMGPAPQVPEAISTKDLESVPSLNIPPAQQPTNFQGVTNGYLEALMSGNAQLDAQATQAEGTSNSLIDEILGQSAGPTETQRKLQLEEQAGLGAKRKDLNSALGRLKALQAEGMILPSVIQQEAQGRGVTAGGVAPIEAGRQRQLQIEQMRTAAYASALADDVNLAQQSVNDLLKIEFEQRTQDLDRAKLAYQFNKDTLDRIDKKRSENTANILRERERLLEADRMEKEAFFNIGIEAARNGASQSEVDAIFNATSREDAMGRAASYLSAPFKAEQEQRDFQNRLSLRSMAIQEAQLKLAQDKVAIENKQRQYDLENGILDEKELRDVDNSPQGKKVKSLGDLALKLSAYRALVDEYGTASIGKEKAKLDSAYSELKVAYKTAADLGAIQTPDLPLIQGALQSAIFDSPFSQAFAKLGGSGRVGSITAGLDQAAEALNNSGNANMTELLARNPKYANSDYVKALALPLLSTKTTVKINGQDVKIGSRVRNDRGEEGTVNADGTITPVIPMNNAATTSPTL